MAGTERWLVVDARAELIRRAKKGRAPLDPMTHQLVRLAVELASHLAYFADLRPFAKWVTTALKHGNRASEPVQPPTFRAEAERIGLPPLEHALATLAMRVYKSAKQHGVRSDEFRLIGQRFAADWDLVANKFELTRPAPAHREISYFTHALAHSLATFCPTDNIGPTTFALILAAIGTDPPFKLHSKLDTSTAAIQARAATCEDVWKQEASRVRTANERYITLPAMPALLLNGEPSRISGNLFELTTGEVIAMRPAGVPVHAKITIERRGSRDWLYARWREAGKRHSVALSPVAHQ